MAPRHTVNALNSSFVISQDFQFVKELGQGAYGAVIATKNARSGDGCAIKKVTNINSKVSLLPMCFDDMRSIIDLVCLDHRGSWPRDAWERWSEKAKLYVVNRVLRSLIGHNRLLHHLRGHKNVRRHVSIFRIFTQCTSYSVDYSLNRHGYRLSAKRRLQRSVLIRMWSWELSFRTHTNTQPQQELMEADLHAIVRLVHSWC